jgi:hypothetical protein
MAAMQQSDDSLIGAPIRWCCHAKECHYLSCMCDKPRGPSAVRQRTCDFSYPTLAYATRGDSDAFYFTNRQLANAAFHVVLLASSQANIYPTDIAAGEIKTLVDGSIISRGVEEVADTGRCQIATDHSLYGEVIDALDLAVGESKTFSPDSEHKVTIKLVFGRCC